MLALGVVGIIRSVHSRVPWVFLCRYVSLARALESLGSSAVFERALGGVEFMSIRWFYLRASWVSWVHQRTFSSLTHDLEVVVYIMCRWVHSREFSASFASSGVTGFSSARPGGLSVLLGSLSSLTYALVVVVLIRCRWVHSRAPCRSLGSSWDVGFAHVRR